jgi:hypothetical protein
VSTTSGALPTPDTPSTPDPHDAPSTPDAPADPSVDGSPGAPSSDPQRYPRLGLDELERLRNRVDTGTALDEATEVAALRAEMARASAATEPAAAGLAAAADEASTRVGHELNYFELDAIWNEDQALAAVKRLYDRERACWRRANGILVEHQMLVRGERTAFERRAPYRVDSRPTTTWRRRWGALTRRGR